MTARLEITVMVVLEVDAKDGNAVVLLGRAVRWAEKWREFEAALGAAGRVGITSDSKRALAV